MMQMQDSISKLQNEIMSLKMEMDQSKDIKLKVLEISILQRISYMFIIVCLISNYRIEISLFRYIQ